MFSSYSYKRRLSVASLYDKGTESNKIKGTLIKLFMLCLLFVPRLLARLRAAESTGHKKAPTTGAANRICGFCSGDGVPL
jgi:hypothetical protein